MLLISILSNEINGLTHYKTKNKYVNKMYSLYIGRFIISFSLFVYFYNTNLNNLLYGI